jgi:hypothetical protein
VRLDSIPFDRGSLYQLIDFRWVEVHGFSDYVNDTHAVVRDEVKRSCCFDLGDQPRELNGVVVPVSVAHQSFTGRGRGEVFRIRGAEVLRKLQEFCVCQFEVFEGSVKEYIPAGIASQGYRKLGHQSFTGYCRGERCKQLFSVLQSNVVQSACPGSGAGHRRGPVLPSGLLRPSLPNCDGC